MDNELWWAYGTLAWLGNDSWVSRELVLCLKFMDTFGILMEDVCSAS